MEISTTTTNKEKPNIGKLAQEIYDRLKVNGLKSNLDILDEFGQLIKKYKETYRLNDEEYRTLINRVSSKVGRAGYGRLSDRMKEIK